MAFRTSLFNLVVRYELISSHKTTLLNRSFIESELDKCLIVCENISLDDLILISLRITSDNLNFSIKSDDLESINVEQPINTHCVGYAAVFNNVFNYGISKCKHLSNYSSYHCRGRIYFLGIEITSRIQGNPFWDDHDFNEIRDRKGAKYCWLDAVLYDKFKICAIEYN